MKIGFVFTHPQHESMGSLVRVRELSTSLVNFGHEVCIFTPFRDGINWGPRIKTYCISALNDFFTRKMYYYLRGILRNPILARYFLLRPGLLERTAANLGTEILKVFKSSNLDLDVIQGEQEIAALALLRIKDKISTPISTDLHNIWAEELAVQNNIRRDSSIYAQLQNLENRIVRHSDACIVVSDAMKSYIEEHYDLGCKVETVPPGSRVRAKKVRSRGNTGKVAYAGLLTRREHVDLFVESMPYVRKMYPNTQFFITSKGEELANIRKLCNKVNVDAHFFWFDYSGSFFEFLKKCNIGVLPSSDDIARKMGTPVKLFDYLSVGVPVVANDIGSWSEMITRYRVGILTKGNPSDFGKGITDFLGCPDHIEECGKRGIELIRTKYNWDNSARLLVNAYKKIV